MRYFLVTYMTRADGKIDEVVSISNRLRNKDIDQSSVILDFQQRSVIKASAAGTNIERDWQRIYQYYQQHYQDIFRQLEQAP